MQLAYKAILELPGRQVLPETLDYREPLVRRVLLDRKDPKVLPVQTASLAPLETLEYLAVKVLPGRLALLDSKEQLASRDYEVILVNLVLRDKQVTRDRLEQQDRQVHLDPQVPQDQPAWLEILELPVLKDNKVCRVLQVLLETLEPVEMLGSLGPQVCNSKFNQRFVVYFEPLSTGQSLSVWLQPTFYNH